MTGDRKRILKRKRRDAGDKEKGKYTEETMDTA
jgi:hypothetical protein